MLNAFELCFALKFYDKVFAGSFLFSCGQQSNIPPLQESKYQSATTVLKTLSITFEDLSDSQKSVGLDKYGNLR